MGSKTLIGGTAYEVKGGKTLVNGTAYSIDKGKAVVNGTAYAIEFVEYHTITVTRGSSHSSMWINGVQYNEPSTVVVPHGTQANFIVYGDAGKRVNLNGTKVSNDISDSEALYVHTVTRDLSVELNEASLFGDKWGVIHITEI